MITFLAIILVGCLGKPAHTLRIGTNVWTGYAPLYLAQQLDWLEPDSYKLIDFPSASDAIRAFRNDLLDIAAVTLDEALILLHSGVDVEILLVMDVSHGADALIAQPRINHIDGLIEKTVAVEPSAVGTYFFNRFLQINPQLKGKITVLPAAVDTHTNLFISNKADAVVTFDPVRANLLEQGGNLLFDSRQINNEIIDVLVVKKGLFQTHSEELTQLKSIWFETIDYIGQKPIVASQLLSNFLAITPAKVRESLALIKLGDQSLNRELVGKGKILRVANILKSNMLEAGLMVKDVDIQLLLPAELP